MVFEPLIRPLARTATYSARYSEAGPQPTPMARGIAAPDAVTSEPLVAVPAVTAASAEPPARQLCQVATDFWLRAMFAASERFPGAVRGLRGVVSRAAFACSGHVRRSTLANAARILGPGSSAADRRRLALGVIESFYLFTLDVGRSTGMSREQLLGEIGHRAGEPNFDVARDLGRGVIVVTAHMGSFEVGLAQMTTRERRLNVIFRRDAQGGFERQRSSLRDRLGVTENPADDGLPMWVRLRDALAAGETVIFQGDRVMPGQRGRKVPFLHGTLELPTGPAKLARISGAPILPVFTVRDPATGKIDLFLEPPITAEAADAAAAAGAEARGIAGRSTAAGPGVDPMLARFAAVLEKYVRAYPDQWLMFHPAFCEDQPPARPTAQQKEVQRA